MPLPADLRGAIASPGGGRVVIVVGAGCSVEPPTSLPLAADCAREVHRRLRADGILPVDCTDPTDLSCVADAVFAATGFQRDLVARLDLDRFRNAMPNDGYLLGAAMLRERAVTCIMTLNFDLAMSSALTRLGAHDVSVVAGPEDHANLGVVNLIYLHRNANVGAEHWILRTAALENAWCDAWEEVITARVLGGPVTVFAGLGTPAGVLVESTTRIRNAIPTGVRVYQVDPADRDSCEFFARLELPAEAYIQMGWGSFMRELADRLVEEHRAELERECNEMQNENGWDPEDVVGLSTRLANLGLLEFGQIRASWLLDDSAYVPRSADNVRWIADMLLALGLIERMTQSRVIFFTDGVVEFRRGDRILGSVVLAHGRGSLRWLRLEGDILRSELHHRNHDPQPRCALVSGVPDGRPATIAPPKSIVFEESATNIVTRASHLEMFSVDELRLDPALTDRMLS